MTLTPGFWRFAALAVFAALLVLALVLFGGSPRQSPEAPEIASEVQGVAETGAGS